MWQIGCSRRCLVGAQKGELVITSLSFDPFDSRHPGWSLGEVTDRTFTQMAGEVGALGMMPVPPKSRMSIPFRNDSDWAIVWIGLGSKMVTRSLNGEKVENLASLCMAVSLHKAWGNFESFASKGVARGSFNGGDLF